MAAHLEQGEGREQQQRTADDPQPDRRTAGAASLPADRQRHRRLARRPAAGAAVSAAGAVGAATGAGASAAGAAVRTGACARGAGRRRAVAVTRRARRRPRLRRGRCGGAPGRWHDRRRRGLGHRRLVRGVGWVTGGWMTIGSGRSTGGTTTSDGRRRGTGWSWASSGVAGSAAAARSRPKGAARHVSLLFQHMETMISAARTGSDRRTSCGGPVRRCGRCGNSAQTGPAAAVLPFTSTAAGPTGRRTGPTMAGPMLWKGPDEPHLRLARARLDRERRRLRLSRAAGDRAGRLAAGADLAGRGAGDRHVRRHAGAPGAGQDLRAPDRRRLARPDHRLSELCVRAGHDHLARRAGAGAARPPGSSRRS